MTNVFHWSQAESDLDHCLSPAHNFDHAVDPTAFHRKLAMVNRRRLAVGIPSKAWKEQLQEDIQARLDEGEFIEASRNAVAHTAALAPTQAAEFVAWFENLQEHGPGQNDPLFDWLASHASMQQMRWFLAQEAAGEAGFDDLLAYTQVQLPSRAKLELARNYWDEMGRGKERGMHGLMLSSLIADIGGPPSIDATLWEPLALANTMLAFALNRPYVYHSIGALGVVELTAPGRVAKVAAGLKRLGFSRRQRAYFDLHAAIDLKHSKAWNVEVHEPLITADSQCAPYIAEGALMRLACGARCFARYRSEMWSTAAIEEIP
jgi:hypothetical protein